MKRWLAERLWAIGGVFIRASARLSREPTTSREMVQAIGRSVGHD